MLGWMHYLGRGTVRDQLKGVKAIQDSRSIGFPFGENECLAARLWTACGPPASRKFFGLCQSGSDRDWLCRHLTAVCLIEGFGTRRDKSRGVEIAEQLAHDGHSDSQYWIGRCYYFGWGVVEDHKKALEWFSKSADQGNSYGQLGVGEYCYFGDGAAEDHAKAFECFRLSAEQGNRHGQLGLGACFKNGYGVTRDIDTALFWYRKSAESGLREALDSLEELGQ
ncbi:uncharacterized protein BJ171DRAFT_502815 [Polychytrium aggregatum]|uniref:uncharacterized protein n=1 Tax=Polychytrium aggregatum TaxID=110093 RepID=UPI0022FDCB2E|nr:uncharacterized protein BJ171DRAFT_502815 [Polychytrium aggregatum]KAI9205047.1 hypothetical protein BJ171DRAFT_502815 [Polychytrium aggregatum]